MANIKITAPAPLYDGMAVSFKAPCACTAVEGLAVTYGGVEKVFTFKDAHGNTLTGIGNLFAEGAVVKVLLDTESSSAYLQNADTSGYIESRWTKKATVTLAAAAWVDGGTVGGRKVFTQDVPITGGTANTAVSLQLNDEQTFALLDDGVLSLRVDNDNGVFTAKAGGFAPTTDMTIQATLTEVSV